VGLRAAALVADLQLPGVLGLDGGAAPENATAEIRRLRPSAVIIVDAADMGEAPGTIQLIDLASARGASFGTHGLPLSVLAGYLQSELACSVLLIGIQPASVEFGEKMSEAAAAAAEELAAALAACLG